MENKSLLNDMRLSIMRDKIEEIYSSDKMSDLEKIQTLIPWMMDITRRMYDLQIPKYKPLWSNQYNEDPVFKEGSNGE
jgi:hypothetical protein